MSNIRILGNLAIDVHLYCAGETKCPPIDHEFNLYLLESAIAEYDHGALSNPTARFNYALYDLLVSAVNEARAEPRRTKLACTLNTSSTPALCTS